MNYEVTLILINKKTNLNLVLYCISYEYRGSDVVLNYGTHSVPYSDKIIKSITKIKKTW